MNIAASTTQNTRADAAVKDGDPLRRRLALLASQHIRSGFIDVSDTTLHVVTAGNRDGRPLLLLHGSPEFWWAWHNQIPPLVAAGYFLIMPDLRGFNHSGKPADFNSYRRPILVADVLAIMDAFGLSKSAIVGHDIGGGIVWWLASEHPERIVAGAIFNASHPAALIEDARQNPNDTSQNFRAFLAQRALSEMYLQQDDFAPLLKSFREANDRFANAFIPGEFDIYRTAWRQTGAMRAMMGHYQAVQTYGFELPDNRDIAVPIRLIWGAQDRYNLLRQGELSLKFIQQKELVVQPQAGHWMLHETPEFATGNIIEFLAGHHATIEEKARPPF